MVDKNINKKKKLPPEWLPIKEDDADTWLLALVDDDKGEPFLLFSTADESEAKLEVDDDFTEKAVETGAS